MVRSTSSADPRYHTWLDDAWRSQPVTAVVSALSLAARAAVVLLAWGLFLPVTATAQQISIETGAEGDAVTVTASAELQVEPRAAWDVISDYDHLADFIPDMRSSRATWRFGDQVLVEQTGVLRILFFQQHVEVKLAVVEYPLQRIVARAVGGNLRELDGRYELESLPAGTIRLSFFGRLVPDFPVPPIVGNIMMRRLLARQFTAMVKEIVRRDASVQGAPQPR